MTNTLTWRDLALEKRSVTEIVTGLSIVAVLGSTLYNLGFFTPIEWSLISLLSVQDMLIGASVAIVPMSLAAYQAWWIARLIGWAPKHRTLACLISIPALVVFGTGAVYFFAGPSPSVTGHLACSYYFLAAVAVALSAAVQLRLLPLAWLTFSLISIPYSVGMASSLMELHGAGQLSEIVSDQEPVRGKVLRMTSGYLLVFDGDAAVTFPMSKIKSVRRLFEHHELEFNGN